MKLLEHHQVGDDVLDIVGHHRRGGGEEENPEVTARERGKSAMFEGLRARGVDVGSQWPSVPRWRSYGGRL